MPFVAVVIIGGFGCAGGVDETPLRSFPDWFTYQDGQTSRFVRDQSGEEMTLYAEKLSEDRTLLLLEHSGGGLIELEQVVSFDEVEVERVASSPLDGWPSVESADDQRLSPAVVVASADSVAGHEISTSSSGLDWVSTFEGSTECSLLYSEIVNDCRRYSIQLIEGRSGLEGVVTVAPKIGVVESTIGSPEGEPWLMYALEVN